MWGKGDNVANEVIYTQTFLFELVERHQAPISITELLKLFKQSEYYQSREGRFSNQFILSCLHSQMELVEDEQGKISLEKWTRRRLDDLIAALREIGEPVHYSVITQKVNIILPPEQQTTAHNIHAQMQRMPDIFVRVGHGIYGLKEWGLHDDGSLANAAYRVLQRAGQPLHVDVIIEKVLKTWDVRPNSVWAAMENDARFSRIGSGIYWLREQVDDPTTVLPKADFGDLFGEKLTRLQAEIDRQQGNSKFDIQAEVDKIRKLGPDFLT